MAKAGDYGLVNRKHGHLLSAGSILEVELTEGVGLCQLGAPPAPMTRSLQSGQAPTNSNALEPQAALFQGSAVYKGNLYCFGGQNAFDGTVLNNVQIYQP